MRKHFKVGDKVVYTGGNLKDLGERPQGVVVGFDHESSYVDFGRKGRDTHTMMGILEDMTGWICYNGHLELAEVEEAPEEVKKTFKDPLPLIEVGGACVFNREGERVVMFVTKSQSFDIVLASRDGAHFFPAQALVMSTCGAVHHRVNYENELVGVYGLPVGNVFVFDEEVENYRPLLWSKGE